MSDVPLYDQFSVNYDRFVNWPARLKYELPFLLDQLKAAGGQRVLDVACGTGQHSIALAEAGYAVTGVDLSGPMIDVARRNAGERGAKVRFKVAGFGELAERLGEQFDALVCLGNSLPHALTDEAFAGALRDFRAVLKPGGRLILQNRNFDLVWRTRERHMGPESFQDAAREWLFVRFYDFHPDTRPPTITFNVLTLERSRAAGAAWSFHPESTELRPIFRHDLETALAAGFGEVEFYGGLAGEAFDVERSGNLVAVARAE